MTTRQSTTTDERSLGRDALSARSYLANRWTLLALGSGLAVGLGLYFGGWGWLVAIGAAPIILSTLPCLIMCGLGVCFMCRTSNKETASLRATVDVTTSSSALGIAKTDASLIAGSSCDQRTNNENPVNALTEGSTEKWKEESHA
jgi:hypothetical protein